MALLKLRVHSPFAIALTVAAAWAALALPDVASADLQSQIDATQGRVNQSRARESALSGDVATFSTIIDRLQGQVDLLQARESTLQADLDVKRAELTRIQNALLVERARLARLRARLAYSRQVLARRLVQIYKSGRPDILTVILKSKGFVDLLERQEFMRRINHQDAAIITAVRTAKEAAKRVAARLAVLEARQAEVTAAVQGMRDQVAAMKQARLDRQSAFASLRADRANALGAVRSGRLADQHTLDSLEAKLAAANMSFGAGGRWVIPWNVVNCESGGRNTGPNSAGASGYYQIIPSTWQLFGGKGPAAHNAPKSEQDRVASKIWAGGSGAGNWDCAH
jgi:peptidoglycan hydrolase CwlO-like protein